MKNNKFLAIGLSIVGAAVLSASFNFGPADTQNTTQVNNTVTTTMQTEVVDNNTHKFTNFVQDDVVLKDSIAAGNSTEVTYKGKVIGEIKRIQEPTEKMRGTNLISSNLTAEETVKIFNELKSEGKGNSLELSASYQEGEPVHTKIVPSMDNSGPGFTPTTDVEKVIIAASKAFRDDTVAPELSKEAVTDKIKAARAKYLEVRAPKQNTLKSG